MFPDATAADETGAGAGAAHPAAPPAGDGAALAQRARHASP